MEEYIKTFDIRKFPGEDVTKASLRLKAVAQSLGTNKLPTDIVHRVLEGFALSSTPTFSQLCHHQESMISSSLVKSTLRQHTLYKTLNAVLSDLEVKYMELLSGNRWLGLGNTVTSASTFFTDTEPYSDDNADTDEYDEYMALTVHAGRRAIPFDIWVKDKVCRNCNAVGHIKRDCPKLRPSKSRSSPYANTHRRPNRLSNTGDRTSSVNSHSSDSHKPSSTKHDYSSKVQALISAANDLTLCTQTHTLDKPASLDDNTPCDTTHDYSGFLAALGCPKE